jgi:dsDNA-specific endonuclease/ATPase MutS2
MGELENAKILAAEIEGPQNRPKLDLHGKFLEEGTLNEVDRFLYACFQNNETIAEVIYGIGEGKMQKYILDFLKMHPLVEEDENGKKSIIEKPGHCIIVLPEKNT